MAQTSGCGGGPEDGYTGEGGLGSGRPVPGGGPLADIGDLEGGGVLAQLGNSCGTCSLSAIFRHFGVVRSPAEIDREIRNANIFSAPDLIARCARRAGFEAVIRNRGTVEEVRGFIGRGIPVVLLVVSKPGTRLKPPVLHYVTAVSCREDGQGFHVGIYNPWGLREEITAEELSLIWDDIRMGPFSCWRSTFLAIAPGGTDLGAGRRAGSRGPDMLGLAVASGVNGVFHLSRDRRLLEGLSELAGTLPRAVIGLALLLVEQSAGAREGSRKS